LDRSKKNLYWQIAQLRVLTQKVGAQVEIKSVHRLSPRSVY